MKEYSQFLCQQLSLQKVWIFLFVTLFFSFALVSFNFSLYPLILTTVLIIPISCFFYKLRICNFPLLLFIVSLAIRLLIVFLIPTPAESDFSVLFNASQRLATGDMSFLDEGYFDTWPYQMGIVFFQSLFLRIFNNIIILKILNCLFASATIIIVYYFAREITCEKSARITSVIYSLMPFSLFYVTVVSNQFVSSFLIYFAFYIVISKLIKNKYIKYFISGVLLVVADVLRPESIIPLFSIVLFLILTSKKETVIKNLLFVLILVVTYVAIKNLTDWLFVITKISPNGLSNKVPYWKFVLGFNHESYGCYNSADCSFMGNRTAALEVIKERIFVPFSKLFVLFSNKIKVFWGSVDMGWTFNFCSKSGLNIFGINFRVSDDVEVLREVSKCSNYIMYLFAAVGAGNLILKKNSSDIALLFINQIFVTMGVYLLIEVQPRYSYHIQISIAVLAALGISYCIQKVKNFKNERAKTITLTKIVTDVKQ